MIRSCPRCGHDHDLWILDLFSGAGGAAEGYHKAGFGVVGVDSRPQLRYPFGFVQADAMTYPLEGFDAYHASPPCHDHMRRSMPRQDAHGTAWMLPSTRERLAVAGARWWILENVPGAPLRVDYKLCGCQFGLWRLGRERWFETSWRGFDMRPPCHHPEPLIECYGGGGRSISSPRNSKGTKAKGTTAERCRAMGIGWMTRRELSQALPPAYTEYLGLELRAAMTGRPLRSASVVTDLHR